jgi:hypothetical protein
VMWNHTFDSPQPEHVIGHVREVTTPLTRLGARPLYWRQHDRRDAPVTSRGLDRSDAKGGRRGR